MFESQILPEQLKSCLVVKNRMQITKVEQLYKVSAPCLDDNQFKKKEEFQTVGAFVKGLLSNPLEMLVHVTQLKTRLSLVGTQTGTSSHKTDKSL